MGSVEEASADNTIPSDYCHCPPFPRTGTLTKNEMTLVALKTVGHQYDVTGVGYAPTGSFNVE